LLERRDGRCYDWQTVERRLGLSVLANIPGKDAAPAPLFDAHSAGAEAFGELRNALLTGLGDEPAVLVVASPSEGFGADVVAANLAVTLARTGHSTSLVIADEDSEIPVMFGLPASDGLTELLRGRVDLTQATHALPDLRALTVLAAGHGLRSEIDDLEGSGITDVLESLAEESRYVIVRARPNDAGADAQFFGRHASAALPVIEIGRTVREAVTAGVRQWQLVGTRVPGAVTVPAFDAPEPAPPRAVASTTAVDPDGGPAPRPALDKDTPDKPRKDQGGDQDPKGPDDDPPSAGPLRKAPPNR
jgi:Mrp family chromosome partitioning ATPase